MPELVALRAGDPGRVGAYNLTARLGEGGQGTVYLGENSAGGQVAVKLLRADLAGDEDASERFVREVAMARRVAPFCTAQVIETGLLNGRPYIVSEYIDGPTLHEVVQREGPRSGPALHRLAIGTVTALVAIHQAGIVHRDFKPSNVVLAADGPRVIDFGIAKALDLTSTLTATAIGTPAFMAPEQLTDAVPGPRADMHAWASTMLYAATGHTPFGADSLPAMVNRILNAAPDISGIADPQLRGLVQDCLEKDPNRRPSAGDALMRLLGHAPGGPFGQAPGSGPPSPGLLVEGTAVAAGPGGAPFAPPDARPQSGPNAMPPGPGTPHNTGMPPGQGMQQGHGMQQGPGMQQGHGMQQSPGMQQSHGMQQGPGMPQRQGAPPTQPPPGMPPGQRMPGQGVPPGQGTWVGPPAVPAAHLPPPQHSRPLRQPPPTRPRGMRTGWVIAAAAVAVLVLAVVGVVTATRMAGSPVTTSPTPRTSRPATPAPTTKNPTSPPAATKRFTLPGTVVTVEEHDDDPIKLVSYSADSGKRVYVRRPGADRFVLNRAYFEYALNTTGARALATDADYSSDGYSQVSIVEHVTGVKRTIKLTAAPVYPSAPRWSPDGRLGLFTLYKATDNDSIPYGYAILDIATGKPSVFQIKDINTSTYDYFWDGDGESVGNWANGDMRFFDLEGKPVARTLPDGGHPLWVESDVLSPSGTHYLAYCDEAGSSLCAKPVSGRGEARPPIPVQTNRLIGWWDEDHLAIWRVHAGGYQAVVVDMKGDTKRVLATAPKKKDFDAMGFLYTRGAH
ncbi:protein kinase domain-containing protein [Nonomuraea endophytica]|uniref:protein kinase domain-containing protein n=1 Tax=Nonomuraea endophytica TaxID=714136 RepID=UPI0037C78C44